MFGRVLMRIIYVMLRYVTLRYVIYLGRLFLPVEFKCTMNIPCPQSKNAKSNA